MPSGCSARKAAICSGRNRWWIEQWPAPQQERRLLALALGQAAPLAARVPDPHVVEAVAHGDAGVAAQVLVGEEQHLVALPAARARPAAQRPLEHGPGVGRGAHGAALAADERLDGRGAVHVGDRHHPVDVDDAGQRVPRLLDLVDVGHVGHRAAGVEVGQGDRLVVAGQDVGRLGHEVHAAEHDVGGLGALLGQHRQAVRVAPGVGPADDLVPLVVVPEDEQAVAEACLGRGDAPGQVVRRRRGVPLVERGLEPKHVVEPPWGGSGWWTVGTARSPLPRGCRPRNRYAAGMPGRLDGSLGTPHSDRATALRRPGGPWTRSVT